MRAPVYTPTRTPVHISTRVHVHVSNRLNVPKGETMSIPKGAFDHFPFGQRGSRKGYASQEQDKSSDIERQAPFSDRKYSNRLPQKRGELQNKREHHII